MDYRFKLMIAGLVDAFMFDYVIAPGFTVASTVINIVTLFNFIGLIWINYMFFTPIDEK